MQKPCFVFAKADILNILSRASLILKTIIISQDSQQDYLTWGAVSL